MSKPWMITRPQSQALCVLTAEWQDEEALGLRWPERVLPALARRNLAESDGVRWRLTELGVEQARRFGAVAAINKELEGFAIQEGS